jgi:hypothetical protein
LGTTLLTMRAKEAVADQLERAQDALYLIWTPNFLMLLLAGGVLAHLVWGWMRPTRARLAATRARLAATRVRDLFRGRAG